jgi:lipoyl(octanoyl) transferase
MTESDSSPLPHVHFQDLPGIRYQAAWDLQTELHEAVKARKLDNRHRAKAGEDPLPQFHHLLFCEHPPVYTLGKSGSLDHLLLDEPALRAGGFEFFKINRGGDITYHGPGQIVGYPILDLDEFFTDVHRYVRYLEEAVIRTIAEYGLSGTRIPGYTGVWLGADAEQPNRKICAIGVHLSRWVTMHGFAFNVQPDLKHFAHIVPCGIQDRDKAVTSLSQELGRRVDLAEVKPILLRHLSELFGFKLVLP